MRENTAQQTRIPCVLKAPPQPLVLAGCIEPLSLAARLVGVSKAMELTLAEPELMHALVERSAAWLLHLPAILDMRLTTFHFGAPMDMAAVLGKVAPELVLCGNPAPSGVFVQRAADGPFAKATELLAATAAHRNFVHSFGCALPPNAVLASLDAFYAAVNVADNVC